MSYLDWVDGLYVDFSELASFGRLRMNAHHLQHADAIAHRQKVVRIWAWVWPRPAGLPASEPLGTPPGPVPAV